MYAFLWAVLEIDCRVAIYIYVIGTEIATDFLAVIAS